MEHQNAAPRSLLTLLKDSADMLRANPGVYLSMIVSSILPGMLMTILVPASRSKEAFNAAFDNNEMGAIFAVVLGGLITRLWDSFLGVSAILALKEKSEGGLVDFSLALSKAASVYVAYFKTGLRAFLWILGGMLLFIVPGLILALRYCLLPYAVLLEGREGAAALERSSQLCKAKPGKIYGNLVGAAIMIVVSSAFVSAVFGVFLPQLLDEAFSRLVDGAAGAWLAGFAVLLYKDVVKAVE